MQLTSTQIPSLSVTGGCFPSANSTSLSWLLLWKHCKADTWSTHWQYIKITHKQGLYFSATGRRIFKNSQTTDYFKKRQKETSLQCSEDETSIEGQNARVYLLVSVGICNFWKSWTKSRSNPSTLSSTRPQRKAAHTIWPCPILWAT